MADEHHRGYRIYAITWFWLLVITLLEVAIVLVGVPRAVLVTALVVLALMKAALIMAYFMHLAYERLTLVYAVVVPMALLAVVMFAFIGPDALSVHRMR
ncbi:MAG: cytochrome C oxidase subunit IV family protein [Armatimonadota bacterium]|nr:cytochrome C oxidase subunit IV family protein [Armatimonadota bacterium]